MTDGMTRRAFVGLAGGAGGTAALAGSGQRASAASEHETTVSTAWEATYGRDGVTWTGDLAPTPDGGYVLACSSAGEPGASDDAWLVAVDGDGEREWDRTYGGEDNDKARAVVRGPDGGYAFLGVTYSKGDGDAWLVHVDAGGETQWERTFADCYPRDLLATSDGAYLVAGGTGRAEDPSSDAWLAKVDADGSARWQATYPDRDGDDAADEYREDEASAVVETADGYAFAGSTERDDIEGWNGWLATVDESGRLTDEHLLPEARHLSDLASTDDGGFAVAGTHESTTATYNVGWLAAVTPGGSLAWSETWKRATPNALVATDEGYVVVGDYDVPWPLGYFEAWAASVTREGDERWRDRFRKNGGEGFDAVVPASDGGHAVLGHTGPSFPDDDEFHERAAWLLELDERRENDGLLSAVPRLGGVAGTLGALSLTTVGLLAGAAVVARWRRSGANEYETVDDYE